MGREMTAQAISNQLLQDSESEMESVDGAIICRTARYAKHSDATPSSWYMMGECL